MLTRSRYGRISWRLRGRLLVASLAAGLVAMPASAKEPIPLDAARAVFDQALELCGRDDGRLWGESLCAPVMLVDPGSRAIVASTGDSNGLLQEADGVFIGRMPESQIIANTAVEWAGVRWTQMLWPLPDDPVARAVLIAHESFHNLQSKLGLTGAQGGDNAHLDSLAGRYWLQLEWRALAKSLRATDERSRREALLDALAFRHVRWDEVQGAQYNESLLELNEGLAQYTGVMVAGITDEERIQQALHSLGLHAGDASFVRSFAYATGPAYGLLLDRYLPGWRGQLDEHASLAILLGNAMGYDPVVARERVASAMARHDSGLELKESEVARELVRQEQLSENRRRFIENPVVTLPLKNMNVQFDPRTLQPVDGEGTVYPVLRVTDDWGVLQAEGGALMKKDWSAVVVGVPEQGRMPVLQGDGWKLELEPGWQLVPGVRIGDWVLARNDP